ncbi:HAD-IA family hydrolase [Oleisolibacter albus]|uniref:HAD-IA family hydrolase n=1 Tax=Oleisolibacter albus TaxID=2171757 RepID=UPI000DF4A899|nr:HAD-IA family hydrolase [Oleisolibacter albus]
MTRSLSLALFDCDGTLVDSQNAILAAMRAGFAAVGLAAPEARAVRRVVGLPLVQAVAVLLPEADSALHGQVAEAYKVAFHDNRVRDHQPEPLFPGIRETLDRLDAQGVLLGVATGKSRRGLLATLELHGLLDRFVTLQTSDIRPGKPHPDMVYHAMAEAGATAETTVVIGDTTFDVEMARNASVPALGVTWGYHEPAELIGAGAQGLVRSGDTLATAILDLLPAAV